MEVLRHDLLHEILGTLVDLPVVDPDFTDVLAQIIPQGTDDDLALLVNEKRGGAVFRCLLDGIPQAQQVIEVPLQFFAGFAHACRAQDQPHAMGDIQLTHGLTGLAAVIALDLAGDTPGAGVVRHQHQVPAGEADEGGEGGPLGAALLLFHLDDEFLLLFYDIADVRTAAFFGLVLEQGSGDFLEGEESVPFRTIVDKGRFKAGLDAYHPALIDI